ncbi:MAG: CYTH domain-containing protein [Erysipelotrichaceae bacterium]
MKINYEKEFKILVNKTEFNALLSCYPGLTFKAQTNTYFDTEEGSLAKLKCALRIREIDSIFEVTLKRPESSGVMEYSFFVNSNDVEELKHPKIIGYLHSIGIYNELEVIGNLETKRAIKTLDKAELCFDISSYGSTTDYEIEYEQTADHNGKKVFNNILKQINLKYSSNCLSKIQRCIGIKKNSI